jgi:predicted nucleotide-binding protein
VAKAPKSLSNRRPWASDDVKTLKSMARKEPASQIAKALKRTEGATRQKATALGISLNTTRGRAAGARRTAVKKAAPKKAAAKKAAPKKAAAKKGGRRG